MKKLAIILLGITFFMASCDDEPTVTTDTEAPMIDARLSLADINCMPCEGTKLNINIEITENDELHEIEAFMQQSFMDAEIEYSNAQAAKIWELNDHSHSQSYVIEDDYTMDTIHHSTFYLIVNASDHNGNSATDTATLHVHM